VPSIGPILVRFLPCGHDICLCLFGLCNRAPKGERTAALACRVRRGSANSPFTNIKKHTPRPDKLATDATASKRHRHIAHHSAVFNESKCLPLRLLPESSTVTRGIVPTATPPQREQTSHSLSSLRMASSILYGSDSSLLSLSHFALGLKYRTWFFSTVFVLGGIGTPPISPLKPFIFFEYI
jgi:hypothetical protein